MKHTVVRSITGTEPNGAGEDTGSLSDSADTGGTHPTADLSAIANGLASSMPEPQEHAINKAAEEVANAAQNPVDKSGTRFDPAIHETGPDGKPVTGVRGNFRAKRGRKGGGAASVMASTGASSPVDAKKAEAARQSLLAGGAAAQMLITAGMLLGGEEWKPVKDEKAGIDEQAILAGAFGEYFKTKEVKDVPPGVALTFALMLYIAPRFAMPQTQAKVSTLKARIVQWWVNRKLRKKGLTATVTARGAEVPSREV